MVGGVIDALVQVAELGEAGRHGGDGEVARVNIVDLVPADRGRYGRLGHASHRISTGNGVVAGVLVVVHKQQGGVAVLAPPGGRHVVRRPAFDLAGEGMRGPPQLGKPPPSISRTRSRSVTGPVSAISTPQGNPSRANLICYGTSFETGVRLWAMNSGVRATRTGKESETTPGRPAPAMRVMSTMGAVHVLRLLDLPLDRLPMVFGQRLRQPDLASLRVRDSGRGT